MSKKRSASTANRTRGGSMATIQVTITPLMLEAVAIEISKFEIGTHTVSEIVLFVRYSAPVGRKISTECTKVSCG